MKATRDAAPPRGGLPFTVPARPDPIVLKPKFDYAQMPGDIAAEAQAVADRIRDRLNAAIYDTGRDLLRIKDRLPHGSFGPWLKAEFGLSERTALNYMNAAKLVDEKSATVADLPPGIVYQLAAPSAPLEVVEAIIHEAEAGTVPDATEVRHRITEAREAQRQAAVKARKTPEQIKKEQRTHAAAETVTRSGSRNSSARRNNGTRRPMSPVNS